VVTGTAPLSISSQFSTRLADWFGIAASDRAVRSRIRARRHLACVVRDLRDRVDGVVECAEGDERPALKPPPLRWSARIVMTPLRLAARANLSS
jgi:hypothetical protein